MQLDRLIPNSLGSCCFLACSKVYDDIPTPSGMSSQSKVGFNIEVTRDGVPVPTARQGRTTKGTNLDAARSFCHIGLDLSSVYHEITFAPSVADWQTKIYEDNTEF